MNTHIYVGILFMLASLSLTARTEQKVEEDSLMIAYLYDHASDKTLAEKRGLLPNRVYVVYSEELARWVYSLTDTQAKIIEPVEVIGTGSVLVGYQLGAAQSQGHFLLDPRGTWVATKEAEKLKVLSFGAETKIRTTEFRPMSDYAEKQLAVRAGNPYSQRLKSAPRSLLK